MARSTGPAGVVGDTPPVHRIDLSLPPAKRYVELAESYRDKMRSLTGLFDELVESVYPGINVIWVKRAARLFLRSLYTHEETEEIKGISKATGIDLYLLVSLNVVLDLLMGCTSGGARCRDAQDSSSKMLHFRTLDWGMDVLRELIVQLEFVRSPETEKVLATSITYVGFVGVLTGVRRNLSVSLNFRPNHDMSKRFANLKFYANRLLVLLGIRRSVSSLLRQYLLPPNSARWNFLTGVWTTAAQPWHLQSLSAITASLPHTPTTAAYIILSDGATTTVLEKDYRSAVTRSSSSFIVATNTDLAMESLNSTNSTTRASTSKPEECQLTGLEGLEDLIEDSIERKACMQAFWDARTRQVHRSSRNRVGKGQRLPKENPETSGRRDPLQRTRSSRASGSQDITSSAPPNTSQNQESSPETEQTTFQDQEVTAAPSEVVKWTSTHPITNEMTHFATVMDPAEGRVVWIQRYLHPLPSQG
ncbi:hypothetical protein PAAG_08885 [Paracoccidioides lutzii Pb01]|uniref:ceramidase n=1 Tax=Paracoccidioides lutzii (strain ATCC MYA-826 / Pb01) TaxID=502779 RepID=C1HDM8_PARBA|nr:hypothetical protein PAAG_08885 [Paracoccidioides lutzii Pb01]EEH40022.1 hypothetical protein PAAG_08885 [Paracoccidioides lutzii Pb01]